MQTEIVREEDLKGEIATDGVLESSVLKVTESVSEGSGDGGGCGIYIVITKQIYINGGQQCNGRLCMHVEVLLRLLCDPRAAPTRVRQELLSATRSGQIGGSYGRLKCT